MQISILRKILLTVNNLILSTSFMEKYRIGKGFSRSRKLSFSLVFYYILAMEKKSLAVNLSIIRQNFPSLNLPLVSKQALSKARQKVSCEAFKDLIRVFISIYYKKMKKYTLWHGYHIFAIDGTTLQIPPSKENLEVFGYNRNQHGKDEPLASASLLYDVMEGLVVDCSISEYRLNERDAAIEHLNTLLDQKPFGSHIVLFDRGYPSYDLFQHLIENNLYFVMRLPSSFKKLIVNDSEDKIVFYKLRSQKQPLALRSIHFRLTDGTMEYLVTNIMEPSFCTNTFKELYFLRWGIEGKYREIKVSLKLEDFSGIKPEIIKQDFYATVFLSNLASLIKSEADKRIKPDNANKNRYQANKATIISQTKRGMISLLRKKGNALVVLIENILCHAVQNRSVIRLGRSFPRRKKYTRRKSYINSKACI